MSLFIEEERTDKSFQEIVGESPALRRMLTLAMKVARSDAPLLILGEAGSGRELIARAVHRTSARKNESFAKVSCAMATDEMLDSEIFGRQVGSGSQSRQIGRLELANNGVLFLDEIANIPLDLQARLLRLLQRRDFERQDSAGGFPVNVRLIATTQYDLAERVAEQTFLEELYDQLNVFPIRVPPLRERHEDIPLLARYFVQKFARRMNKQVEGIPVETMNLLMNSDWPGNVRQLENWIQRAVVVTEGPALRVPLAGLHPKSGMEIGYTST